LSAICQAISFFQDLCRNKDLLTSICTPITAF